jgi:hypothetical protein
MGDPHRNERDSRRTRRVAAQARVQAALSAATEAMERIRQAAEALRPMREMSAEWVWLLSLCDQMRLAEVVIEDRLYGLRLQGGSWREAVEEVRS